jgi:hypothetical protein
MTTSIEFRRLAIHISAIIALNLIYVLALLTAGAIEYNGLLPLTGSRDRVGESIPLFVVLAAVFGSAISIRHSEGIAAYLGYSSVAFALVTSVVLRWIGAQTDFVVTGVSWIDLGLTLFLLHFVVGAVILLLGRWSTSAKS